MLANWAVRSHPSEQWIKMLLCSFIMQAKMSFENARIRDKIW